MRSRSFLKVLLVLLCVCAPVMAATVAIVDNADGTVTVSVTADGAVNIVGLALDIEVDSGAAVMAVSIETPCFDIFPDAAYDLGASYNYGDGTAIADQTAPGETALPAASFTLCAGCLNGAATPGADGAAAVQFTLTLDMPATVCVTENAIRGGIVGVDGSSINIPTTCAPAVPCPCECLSSSAPFYTDWVAFGSPDCWCYAKNCLGDADGLMQGTTKTGFVAVSTNDLAVLSTNWQIKEPPAGPGVGYPGICADFDRAAQGTTKTGFVRVSTNDLAILSTNWQIKEPPAGPGIGDCSDYGFFITP